MSLSRRAAACANAMGRRQPLVHCLVGPVAMGACANLLLAAGARPIMAQAPEEAAEIAAQADALLLNTGTVSAVSARAMLLAAPAARQAGNPIVLDLVGMGVSTYRTRLLRELLDCAAPAIVKGNASEIRYLLEERSRARGVDAAGEDRPDQELLTAACGFAAQRNCALLITGATDYIALPGRVLAVSGGHPLLGRVTATGCMAGALCAALSACGGPAEAALAAVCVMDLAGEAAGGMAAGPGAFAAGLLDAVAQITPAQIENREEWICEEAL